MVVKSAARKVIDVVNNSRSPYHGMHTCYTLHLMTLNNDLSVVSEVIRQQPFLGPTKLCTL